MQDVPHEVATRLEENIREALHQFEREFDVRRASIIEESLGEDNTIDVTIQYFVDNPDIRFVGIFETCKGYMWFDREENYWHLSAAPEWATY